MITLTHIHIWGVHVGAALWDNSRGYATLEFTPEFVRNGWELSPLTMPLSGGRRIFSFPLLRQQRNTDLDTFHGLPGLLADSLPDRYGNALINVWLSRNGRPENSMNPVETLCFIGNRGMGALEFTPPVVKDNHQDQNLEIEGLVNAARQALSGKKEFTTNLDGKEEEAIRSILKMGTSAGGARPKALIAYKEETGEVRSGQTDVSPDFEHWILKLDGVSDIQLGDSHGYGRVEMAYYDMALDCGITMMPSRLLEENGRAHFMTKRFDRGPGNVKHHVQSLCALKHYDYNEVTSFSYEQLFQTMRELGLPYPAAEQMFRRMAFNVMARNCDDHTKNFSFLLRKGGSWELAPAYDLCHAYKPDHRWVSRHALSINGKRENITRQDLLGIAKSIGYKKATETLDQIGRVVGNWTDYAENRGVKDRLSREIGTTLLPL